MELAFYRINIIIIIIIRHHHYCFSIFLLLFERFDRDARAKFAYRHFAHLAMFSSSGRGKASSEQYFPKIVELALQLQPHVGFVSLYHCIIVS